MSYIYIMLGALDISREDCVFSCGKISLTMGVYTMKRSRAEWFWYVVPAVEVIMAVAAAAFFFSFVFFGLMWLIVWSFN